MKRFGAEPRTHEARVEQGDRQSIRRTHAARGRRLRPLTRFAQRFHRSQRDDANTL